MLHVFCTVVYVDKKLLVDAFNWYCESRALWKMMGYHRRKENFPEAAHVVQTGCVVNEMGVTRPADLGDSFCDSSVFQKMLI